jgi:hypothetical protein
MFRRLQDKWGQKTGVGHKCVLFLSGIGDEPLLNSGTVAPGIVHGPAWGRLDLLPELLISKQPGKLDPVMMLWISLLSI